MRLRQPRSCAVPHLKGTAGTEQARPAAAMVPGPPGPACGGGSRLTPNPPAAEAVTGTVGMAKPAKAEDRSTGSPGRNPSPLTQSWLPPRVRQVDGEAAPAGAGRLVGGGDDPADHRRGPVLRDHGVDDRPAEPADGAACGHGGRSVL